MLTFALPTGFLQPVPKQINGVVCPDWFSKWTCSLTGGQRRTLRSEAGRREASGNLAYFRLPEYPEGDPSHERARHLLCQKLTTEELVRVQTGQKKKKLAKEIGGLLAEDLDAEVCQVIGHTVLLYKPAEKDSQLRPGLTRIVFS